MHIPKYLSTQQNNTITFESSIRNSDYTHKMMNHYVFCMTCEKFLEIFQIQNHIEKPLLGDNGYPIHENSFLIRGGETTFRKNGDKKYLACECGARISENWSSGPIPYLIKTKYTHVLVQDADRGINLPLMKNYLRAIKYRLPHLLDYREYDHFSLD